MPARAKVRRRPPVRSALVYRAIADPVRRDLLQMLAAGDRTAGALAEAFVISRPAVSKHLAVLRRAGLVEERKVGRERYYTLRGEPLRDVLQWVTELDRFWTQRLQALGEELDAGQGRARRP
jgi:DNA-binding transcriptional ArsR family regulator